MTSGWQLCDASGAQDAPALQTASAPARGGSWRCVRTVAESDVIQPYRHVWNVTLARWFDELAAMVFDRPGTLAQGLSWFILSQETRFRAETMQGDRVLATATMPAIERSTATLDVRLERVGDSVLLVESSSTWVLVTLEDRRPRRIDDAMRRRLGGGMRQ